VINYYAIKAVDAEDASEPLDLEDAKAFMRVDYDDDNELISSLIKASRKLIQKQLGKPLVKSDVTLTVKTSCAYAPIELAYYSNATAFAVSDLDTDSLAFTGDEYTITGNQIAINYKGAFALSWTETPEVDADVLEAIKMLVAYRYNNRGDQEKQTGIPEDIETIIDQNRVVWL
jgi:hypothetical protein